MRNLFFFVLVIVVGSSYYVNNKGSFDVNPASSSSSIAHPTASNFNNFRCDGRQHCSQMSSFIENCPNTKMDGDNDGIPCERQFGH